MLRFISVSSGFLCAAVLLGIPQRARAAVSLTITPTSATSVTAGMGFTFSVKLNETSSSDEVSGVDYELSTTIASGAVKLLTRNSQTGQFTFPNGDSDGSLPMSILNPTNGTDLGTSTTSGNAIPGPSLNQEVADYSFQVVSGTPNGIYTLSFVDTSYSGIPSDPNAHSFDSLGTLVITVVPEPASGLLVCAGAGGLVLRRRRR